MRHGRERTTPQALPNPQILTSFYACLIRPGPILASRGGSFLASAEDVGEQQRSVVQFPLLFPDRLERDKLIGEQYADAEVLPHEFEATSVDNATHHEVISILLLFRARWHGTERRFVVARRRCLAERLVGPMLVVVRAKYIERALLFRKGRAGG